MAPKKSATKNTPVKTPATPAKTTDTSLETADAKKESLRKAFEDLQSHSSSLSSFTLQWKDLEDHFATLRQSIEARLKELESKEKSSSVSNGTVTASPVTEPEAKKKTDCETHPEMKTLCSKMDGPGLRAYILKHNQELNSIREEIGIAFQSASDPAKMVLDAMGGFYQGTLKEDKSKDLGATRRNCLLMLEELRRISPKLTPQVKEKAKKLALEWKGNFNPSETPRSSEPLALLQLVATYGISSEFDSSYLFDLAVPIARRKQAVDILKALDFPEKIPDFIEKLTNDGKHIEAVKFVYAFELVEKIPPVPLLKAFQKHSQKVGRDIRSKGNNSGQSLNESYAKEIASLKSIIKCVEEYKLESEFPMKDLDKQIEQLEKKKAERKRAAPGPAKKQQQLSGNKRARVAGNNPVGSTAPSVSQTQTQTHMQPASSFNPYMTSSAHYGLNVPSYMTPTAGSYGLGTSSLGYGGVRTPPRSSLYSSDARLPSGLHDRSMGFGGHGMPPSYRSSFYP